MANKRFDNAPKFVVKDDSVVIQQAVGSSAPLLDVKDHTGSSLMSITSAGAVTGANMTSPTLTGTPTAPTAAAGTNTTQVATTAFVRTEISNLVASAPAALDTLDELAAALGDDANFATTVTNNLATKAPLAGPTFTGTVTLPATTSIGTVSATEIGYVDGVTSAIQTQLNAKAPTASPTFTGDANFDSGTLYIDGTNNRIGVSTTSPAIQMHLWDGSSGNAYNLYSTQLRIEKNGQTGISIHTPTASEAIIGHATPLDGASSSIIFDGATRAIRFTTVNGTTRVTIDSNAMTVVPRIKGNGIDIGGTGNTDSNSIACNGWFRSYGQTGWYNQTYGGGINMQDSTYIRVYGNMIFLAQPGYAGAAQYGSYGSATLYGTTGGYAGWVTPDNTSACMWTNIIFGHYRNNSTWNFYVQTGTFYTSDERYKRNIQPLEYGLDFIKALEPVSYLRLTEDPDDDPETTYEQTHYGFTSQQVLRALEAVGEQRQTNTVSIGGPAPKDGDDRQYLNTGEFIAPIVKAIQEMAERIEQLESLLNV